MDRHALFGRLTAYFADKPGVSGLVVFGSFANGTNSRRSDLDLVVIERTEKRFIERLTTEYLDLDETAGVAVDVLIYTPEEWEKKRRDPFFANAPMEVIR